MQGETDSPLCAATSLSQVEWCVERAHRTHDEEFYQVYSMTYTEEGIRAAQEEWEYTYNHERPHQVLNYQTSVQYLQAQQLHREEDVSPRY